MNLPLAILPIHFYNLSMTQPFKLFRLQLIDSQIDQINARLAALQAELSDTQAIEAARAQVQAFNAALESQRKALKHAEQRVQEVRIKKEQTEASLYGGKVRDTKELRDLEMESGALGRRLSVLEDEQLAVMLTLEEAENAQKASAGQLQQAETADSLLRARLRGEQANQQAALEKLQQERAAAAVGLAAPDIEIYERLRKQRRGIAVARVSEKTCTACGVTLNASLMHAALSASQLAYCDSCGRILYLE
jgi:hypothetical protein